MERKETKRRNHDNTRKVPTTPALKRGDLVHKHHTTALPKLQYQWTAATWLVLEAQHNTCLLKPLTIATVVLARLDK